ncbi:MAG: hypothetical protein ACRD2B_01780 [Terriglobia bacterium]
MTNVTASAGTGTPASLALGNNTTEASLQPASTPQARKLLAECRNFEGILIANLWDQMEQGLGLSGPSTDPGSETMQGFGIQAAAMGIASAGGFGVARMLYHALAPSLRHS